MNAGNMGIPLALFAFGPAGMQRATLLFVIINFFQYSLGIYILSGRGNWTGDFPPAADLRDYWGTII
jgi:predicted permease